MIHRTDYMIVGQGLAGTLLASMLIKRGRQVVIFDQGHATSSSKHAAGIINPITGRRFVKSWMFDQLLDQAIHCYRDFEKHLGVQLIRQLNIVRQLPDQKSHNDWLAKSADEEYKRYILPYPDLQTFGTRLKLDGFWAEVTKSYQIDIPLLISSMRIEWEKKGILRTEHISYDALQIRKDGIQYKDIQSHYLICCEGAGLISNALFDSKLYFNPSKGDVLLLRIPDFSPGKMIKKKFFLVPLEKELFWFGAKDGWHFSDHEPSDEAYDLLLHFAKELINLPFMVLDHQAAIRPTIKDRRPVIGKNAKFDQVYLFNGMGTKGASLGPYWADYLIRHIEEGLTLPEFVNHLRYSKESNRIHR